MSHYRVRLQSAPGMWTSYEGHVDVSAESALSAEEAFAAAVRKLARTSFPDRPSLTSWRLVGVEVRP